MEETGESVVLVGMEVWGLVDTLEVQQVLEEQVEQTERCLWEVLQDRQAEIFQIQVVLVGQLQLQQRELQEMEELEVWVEMVAQVLEEMVLVVTEVSEVQLRVYSREVQLVTTQLQMF
jgi:hypothetical protein